MKTIKELEAEATRWNGEKIQTLKDVLGLIDEILPCEPCIEELKKRIEG